MQNRKTKGLCFNCDEKYTPTHKCTNGRLLPLQWNVDSPKTKDPNNVNFVVELDTTDIAEEHVSKLSPNVMNITQLLDTLSFTDYVMGHSIRNLLDGGSDDRFKQPCLAKFLQLDIQPTQPINVLVGNANSLSMEGYIEALQVTVQGNHLTLPVYVLPIAGVDLILGATWLATLGPYMVDYSAHSIQFYGACKFITLQCEVIFEPNQLL